MTDSEIVKALAEKVMGWRVVERPIQRRLRYDFSGPDVFMEIDGTFWRGTKADGNCTVPWRPLESMDDAWMIIHKLRDMWTAATEGSSGVHDDFEHPFDDTYFFDLLRRNADRRWPWALLYVTPRAIAMAALRAVGVDVEG